MNYITSKIFVFNKKKRNINWKSLSIYFASFLFPAIIMLMVFCQLKISPFGDRSVAIADAKIQYLDFFRYFRRVLQGKDSFLYSFQHFFGSTGIGTYAYYLASPFNYLIFLFKEGNENTFFSLLVLLKIAMCGFTFCVYVKKRFPKLEPLFVLILSSGYALMQYTIVQASNIMWLDGVYMLPLVLLGVWQIVQSNYSLNYVISLFFSIIFCWYTGYFNCIAVAVYFFFELLVMQNKNCIKSNFFYKLFMIIFQSLIGIGLSAFLLIPTIMVLQNGKGEINYVFNNTFYANPINIFQGFAIGSGMWSNTLLFLFCGTIAFMGLLLYFTNESKDVKQRLGSAVVFIFMICLAYYKPLEYVANGFREVSSYWFRFSYIIIFYVVFFAASEYENFQDTTARKIVKTGFLGAILMLICNYIREEVSITHVAETVVVIFILSGLLYFWKKLENKRLLISSLLVAITAIELFANASIVFSNMGFYSSASYKSYANCAEILSEQLRKYDQSFYRVAQTEYREQNPDTMLTAVYNDSLAYGYKGITHYSSTYDRQQALLLKQLGYSTLEEVGVNTTRILSSDSLLGTKYIFSKTDIKGLELVTDLKPQNEIRTYKNPFALYEAVVFPDTDIEAKYEDDPFEYQNQLFSQLYGKQCKIFNKLQVEEKQTDEGTIYTVPACEKDEIIYYFSRFSKWTDSKIYANDKFLTNYSCWLSPASVMVSSGDTETEVKVTNTKDAVMDYGFYTLDLTMLKSITEKLNETKLEKAEIRNGYAAFSVNGQNDTRLLVQIPENKGWKIWINGEPAKDVKKFAGCLYSIGLRQGACEITMKYTIPGLYFGIGVSGIMVCVLIAFSFKQKNGRRK